jgi:hypothetical protein
VGFRPDPAESVKPTSVYIRGFDRSGQNPRSARSVARIQREIQPKHVDFQFSLPLSSSPPSDLLVTTLFQTTGRIFVFFFFGFGLCLFWVWIMIRVMTALWVPFDDIYCGHGSSKPSLCDGLSRVGWGSCLPCSCEFWITTRAHTTWSSTTPEERRSLIAGQKKITIIIILKNNNDYN